jgi:hypothetical protein
MALGLDVDHLLFRTPLQGLALDAQRAPSAPPASVSFVAGEQPAPALLAASQSSEASGERSETMAQESEDEDRWAALTRPYRQVHLVRDLSPQRMCTLKLCR